MRRTGTKYLFQLIVLSGLLIPNNNIYSQKRYELSGGLGWPGLLSINCRYGSDLQAGIGVGFFRMKDSFSSNSSEITYWNFSADLYDHFGGRSEVTGHMPWYINVGIAFTPVKTFESAAVSEFRTNHDTYISLYSRIGRTINFSAKFGLTIDLGVNQSINLMEGENIIPIMILPAFSTGFFIRL